MLYNLLKHQTDRSFVYKIISLGSSHYYEDMIRNLNIELIDTDFKRNPIQSLLTAYKNIRGCDVLCCWTYKCNLIGYYLGKIAKTPRIFWFVRHANLSPQLNPRRILLINRLCAPRSRKVYRVSYNGNLAKAVHEDFGYDKSKSIVAENGCDTQQYRHIEGARKAVDTEFGLEGKKIVLSVSNYRPIKDVPTFIKAFKSIHDNDTETVALLCGLNIDKNNAILVELIKSLGLAMDRDIFLLGLRHDVPVLMSACDLFILHSAGEAFPNTLLQAMACEALIVSTDVGDAKQILGNGRYIAEPGNSLQIAEKAGEMLRYSLEEKVRIRENNRKTVTEKYNIQNIVKNYERLYFNE